jgi:hypothetical protein
MKVTPPSSKDLVYYTRHASIHFVRQHMTNLEEFEQDMDLCGPCPESPSQYEELHIIIQANIFYRHHLSFSLVIFT